MTPATLDTLPASIIRLIAYHLVHDPSNTIYVPNSLTGNLSAISSPLLGTGSGMSRSAGISSGGSSAGGRDRDGPPSVFAIPDGKAMRSLGMTCRAIAEALAFAPSGKTWRNWRRNTTWDSPGTEDEEELPTLAEAGWGQGKRESFSHASGSSSTTASKRKRSASSDSVGAVAERRRAGREDRNTTTAAADIDPSLYERPSRAEILHASKDPASTPDHLYRRLSFETFDSAAVFRRFGDESHIPPVQHRRRSRRHDHGSSDRFPSHHAELDLFRDPRPLAEEYKERMDLFRRMRLVVAHKSFDVERDHSASSLPPPTGSASGLDVDAQSDVGAGDFRMAYRRADVEGDLWRIWWMVTEHDSRNINLLFTLGQLAEYIVVYYHCVTLMDFKEPGYPKTSAERGLFAWLCVRVGIDKGMLESSPQTMDERLFLHKPFALACFKYPNLLGPWLFRHLPLSEAARSHEELNLISGPNPFMSELTPTSNASEVTRFGRKWSMAAPSHNAAVVLSLARLLDRHPEQCTLQKVGQRTGSGFPSGLGMPRDLQLTMTGSKTISPRPRGRSVSETMRSDAISSLDFDMDVRRSLTCLSPIDSPGLPPLFYRNKLRGLWVGKYLYMDHHDYKRAMLGDIRSMYESPIGGEEQEFYFEESVINVRIDRVGGDGPALSAGFKVDMDDDELREDEEMDAEQRGWEPCMDENAPDRPGWTKEIILQGKGQSTWGPCNIYGRIRGWDGLIIWRTDYGPQAVDRWLWRTYIHAGDVMIGRFRDSFTPENVRAYEGSVAMFKVNSPLHAERQRERVTAFRQSSTTTTTSPPSRRGDYDATIRGDKNPLSGPSRDRPTLPPISHFTQRSLSPMSPSVKLRPFLDESEH